MTFPSQGRSEVQKFKPLLLTHFIQCILHCVGKKPVFSEGNSSLYQPTRKTPCQGHLRNEFLLPLIVFCFGFFFLLFCFAGFWFFVWFWVFCPSVFSVFHADAKSICIYICKRKCEQTIASVLTLLAGKSLGFFSRHFVNLLVCFFVCFDT